MQPSCAIVTADVTGADACAQARAAVRDVLGGAPLSALRDDAELVVSELVTNALLHGAPPVSVQVSTSETAVRVVVSDGSRFMPVVGLGGPDAMTGRGLALVAMLADRWGAEPQADGKTVWAELTVTAPDDDAAGPLGPGQAAPEIDALLPGWRDATADDRVTVRLGDVPTDLLIEAKAHVDNLAREFALVTIGAASGQAARVPPRLAELLTSVTTRFAEGRLAMKRQALRAAAAGAPRTSLVLHLPVTAADAAEAYLAAIDELDDFARAARLLTVESPPQHRAFRQWYVEVLVEQLRRAKRGEPPARTPSFEARLLDEVARLSDAYRAADRAARLQGVTAALATATEIEDVARIVVAEGVAALGASGGGLLTPGEHEGVAVPAAVGYDEPLVARLRAERRDAPLPAAESMRTGTAIWLESRQDVLDSFPQLVELEPRTVALCAVPVYAPAGLRGVLRFSFTAPRVFDEGERAFVLALAAETAQAVERSDLYAAERAARTAAETAARRLAVLQQLTAGLAGATTIADIAAIVVDQAREVLGAVVTSLSLLEGPDTLRVVGLRGAQPGMREQYRTFPLDADLPGSVVVRSAAPIVVGSVEEMHERFPSLAHQDLGERSLVGVPLLIGDEALGVLTLTFPGAGAAGPDDVELLATIGRQSALAVQRVRLRHTERRARERAAFLADAGQLLLGSLEPDVTLAHLTTLLVPRFADWAVVYLRDEVSGEPRPIAFAHRDPALTERIRVRTSGQRLDMTAAGGVAEVLRTGRSIRYASVPDEIAARAVRSRADDAEGDALRPRTGVATALTVRGSVIGVLTLARTGDDPYTDEDFDLIEDLAARAAVAVSNARAYTRERDAAVVLQHSLLPQTLPETAGLSAAWRYRPAGAGTPVGGDWYDVIPLDDGTVGIVIGDVMGRGLHAAAVMGQLRATARAYASAQMAPADVLARLDATLTGLEQTELATALYGALDPASGRLRVASAGHLPPLVVPKQGPAYFLDIEPAPPLGTGSTACSSHSVVLPDQAVLLLFTDGLVEDQGLPVDQGMAVLRDSVRHGRPDDVCDRALRALGRDRAHDDDVAVLALALGERTGATAARP